jgi:DNA-binding XRE family transcriptional regulator
MSTLKNNTQTSIRITSADTKHAADMPTDRHAHIGTILRHARETQDLSASQLAGTLGFPIDTIAAIESGQTEDQLPCMLAMALVLDLDLQDLFGPTIQRLQ